jgi:aminoglycoside phosphotransferase family enzyme/predicted kinase
MDASVVETHVSVVFFVGDHVYKLKKPVTFDFVDQSTRVARAALCHREVELNRRLAPDVYEDVATIVGSDGEPMDHLVMMKRLPADRRLSSLVAAHDPAAPEAIDQIAVLLARFHAGSRHSDSIDEAGTLESVLALWDANAEQLHRFAGAVLDPFDLERSNSLARAFVAGRRDLFDRRIAGGWICDGHGDLLADDIYVLDDGPRIIDCLEFADRLRFGDVVADLAFLAMDLERLGAPELADRLVRAYEEESGFDIPPALLHYWVGYRAQIRVLVACLRQEQERADSPEQAAAAADQARNLLQLCIAHLNLAIPRLVLVGGLPGTGKSTVARGVGEALRIPVLRSDVVRKELVGMSATTPAPSSFGTGIYDDDQTARTYAALAERAALELALGRSVVVDASFIAGSERAAARGVARAAGVPVVELRCAVPASEAHRRIQARLSGGEDPSDADSIVAARMAELDDPWPESIAVSTACSPAESVDLALAAIRATAPVV